MTAPELNPTLPNDPCDFSLVMGGPLHRLSRRAHLACDPVELVGRRTVVLVIVAWIPLLLLSILQGVAWRGTAKLPFLFDISTHVRFLLALPLLLSAEVMVHRRLMPVARQFVDRGLAVGPARARFDAALASAMRLRDSVLAELSILALVYLVGMLYLWRTHIALDVTSWMGSIREGRLQPSAAGWWFGCISLPLFQFMLLRWYFRLFIWARFLWQVSRIDLALIPIHPDRCGGLGFLSGGVTAFVPLLLAQGAMLAGLIAERIFFAGAHLTDFKAEVAVIVAIAIAAVAGPLLSFVPILTRTRRAGLREYGALAQRYVRDFDCKWLGHAPSGEQFLGSADIQSLADLGNSYEIIKGMKPTPITRQMLIQLVAAILLPCAPLLLTMISLEELLSRALKLAF